MGLLKFDVKSTLKLYKSRVDIIDNILNSEVKDYG